MLNPKTLSKFQRVVEGLRIIGGYLSRYNPGDITCQQGEILASGVHYDALGGDDLAMLEALGWRWRVRAHSWSCSV